MPEKTFIILIPGFPKDENDTTCLPMQQAFVKALKQKYPAIKILVLAFQYPYVFTNYRWHGIEVISFNGQNKGGFSRILLQRRILKALKGVQTRSEIIGLLSFWYGECAYVGRKFARRYNLSHYCWLMGQDAKKSNPYVTKILPNASELIALSDFIQTEFKKNHFVCPQFVIPPGVEQARFIKPQDSRDVDILTAGSLLPLKQYHLLPQLVQSLKKSIPMLKMMMVGKGPQKEQLEELISKFNLGDTITLTGELPYSQLIQLMQRAKVFLHPSAYEGFSGVCLEASTAGAQVVSFCQPMSTHISNWHIVTTLQEMEEKTLRLLREKHVSRENHIIYTIEDTVDKMASLYRL